MESRAEASQQQWSAARSASLARTHTALVTALVGYVAALLRRMAVQMAGGELELQQLCNSISSDTKKKRLLSYCKRKSETA